MFLSKNLITSGPSSFSRQCFELFIFVSITYFFTHLLYIIWRICNKYICSTLPICTVGQNWLRGMNVISVDLLSFILILHLLAQSPIMLVAWSFTEAIAGSSCVAKIAVSSTKVAVVVLSDVGRSLVKMRHRMGPLRHFLAVHLLQFSLRLWFLRRILLERVRLLDMILIFCNMHGEGFFWFWTRRLGAIFYKTIVWYLGTTQSNTDCF
jgi:hypothetical protein